ncbi:hypothetical protein PYW08_013630 [Mythimna loreyi]|uniref:Uncharacterized protein n=1 Tax=Mythimna loreyi TaxID=667449 RepID=A0ACC2QG80_9NEOP|nr:hypothetical protein PYW08_013630 [Mythimna loreyi]
MIRIHQTLVVLTLLVGLAHSFDWDVVVGALNKLEFYNNGALVHSEDFGANLSIEELVHDVVHNRLLIADINKNQDTLIFSFNIATKELLPLVKRTLNNPFQQRIHSMAYDPVTEKLFWTDSDTISWFSLKPGFVNNIYGTTLIEFDLSTPFGIAVDSCKGYIYWAYDVDGELNTIEKVPIDGSDREIVLEVNMSSIYNLVIDQQTRKMYWTDDVPTGRDKTFSINSADLNGENRRTLYIDPERNQPRALSVSKDSIYWVPLNVDIHNIWKIPKNPTEDTKPTAVSASSWYTAAAKYNIEDQIQGIQGCESLRNLLPKIGN